MSEMSGETVRTNAGQDAVSGLSGDPVWKGEGEVNAKEGEDIRMSAQEGYNPEMADGQDEDDSRVRRTTKEAAKKTSAPKQSK